MSDDDPLPKGFRCVCGEANFYNEYVYTHWDDSVVRNCPICDRKYFIWRGEARPAIRWGHEPQPKIE